MGYPRFLPVADHAVLVEFAEALSPAAHRAVLRLDRALAAAPCAGLAEAVPSYVALMVVFDPVVTDHAAVTRHLRGLLEAPEAAVVTPVCHDIPVCYDTDLAPDLEEVALRCGLTPEAVIAAHLAGVYDVAMYGFAPGYAYLAGVPEGIRLDRKPSPRRGVAAGSVIIAGPQCLITTLTMPTGWWVIGRTPARILTGDPGRPFRFEVGDAVRFRRVDRAGFDRLSGGAA